MSDQQSDRTHERIEELKKRLYQKDFTAPAIPVASFKKKEGGAGTDAPREWERELPKLSPHAEPLSRSHTSMWKKIFFGSLIFFVAALAFAWVSFREGGNVLTAEKVSLAIEGPDFAEGGEELSLRILVRNENDAPIESANLVILYPEGAYDATAKTPLVRDTDPLGVIPARGSVEKNVKVSLFGQEGEEKVIQAGIEFRFKDTSAVLQASVSHPVTLSSAPLDVSISAPEDVGAGQEFDMVVRVVSSSDRLIPGVRVVLEYPFGFTELARAPNPIPGERAWDLGDMAPGASRDITIRGKIDGVADEERVFRARAGSPARTDAGLEVAYGAVSRTVVIKKPFLTLSVSLNGEKGTETSSVADRLIRGDILWENTLPVRLSDVEVSAAFSGTILDRLSVLPGIGGFFRSLDNTIIWTPAENPSLAGVEPGAKGTFSFSFSSLPLVSGAGTPMKTPEISILFSAKGKRAGESAEEVFVREKRSVRIESDLRLAARALYFSGPFKNMGPLPPKAEQETTYTVVWTITNSSNTVSDAIVRATLPPYAKWKGVVSPDSEQVSFNESGGEVVWKAGSVAAGAGLGGRAREVAFQIGIVPSVSQAGKIPVLVREAILTGRDTWTRTTLTDREQAHTTALSGDSGWRQEYAPVSL